MKRLAQTMEQAKALLEAHSNAAILDVRTEAEYVTGHLDGAILLSVDQINARTAAEALPDRDAPVLVYCRSGARSRLAVQKLTQLGYTDLYDLGGLAGWPYGLVSGWL